MADTTPDPVFAALAAEAWAWKAYNDAMDRQEVAEVAYYQAARAAGEPRSLHQTSRLPEAVVARRAGTKAQRVGDLWSRVVRLVAATSPTTTAGAVALVVRFGGRAYGSVLDGEPDAMRDVLEGAAAVLAVQPGEEA